MAAVVVKVLVMGVVAMMMAPTPMVMMAARRGRHQRDEGLAVPVVKRPLTVEIGRMRRRAEVERHHRGRGGGQVQVRYKGSIF